MGPTAGILVRNTLANKQQQAIRTAIAGLSEKVDGDNFWIQGRPLSVGFGPCDEDEEDFKILCDKLGWTPQGCIDCSAGCNSDIDHRVLGEVCLHFVQLFNGVVDFCGELPASALDGPGKLWSLPYQSVMGIQCISHFSDAEFLAWWLQQPEFYMIK
ncbi:MAG: hypothetical protein JW818_17430 [Pirellulales bacterium]|nr:hypothetical protein [Pirellulales bacterium]